MTNAKFVKTAAAVALGASVVTTAVAPGAASAATKYKVNSKGNLVLKSTGSLVKGWVEFGGKLYKNGKPAPAKKYKIMGTGASMKLYFGPTLKKGYKTANSKSLLFKDGKLLKGNKQTADRTRYYENGKLATGWDVVAADETKYIYKSGKLFKEPKTATRDGVFNYFENGKLAEGTKAFKDTLFTDGTVDEKDQVFEDVLYVGGKKAEGTKLFEDTLYVDGKVPTAELTKFEEKYYDNKGKLANGEYTIDGEKVELKDGVIAEAKIVSVTPVNSKELKVNFSADVTKFSDVALTDKDGNKVYFKEAKLAEDKKSATIALYDALKSGETYNLTAKMNDKEVKTSFQYAIGAPKEVKLSSQTIEANGKVAFQILDENGVNVVDSLPEGTTVSLESDQPNAFKFANGEITSTLTAGQSAFLKVSVKDKEGKVVAESDRVTVSVASAGALAGFGSKWTLGTANFDAEDFKAQTTVAVDSSATLAFNTVDQYGKTANLNGAKVEFTSLNPEVAVVDQITGKVTPVKEGTAVVRATLTKDGKVLDTKTVEFKVTAKAVLTSLVTDKDAVKVTVGGVGTKVAVSGLDQFGNKADVTGLTATSADEKIAKVTTSGNEVSVEPVAEGTTTVTVKVGELTKTISVTVTKFGTLVDYSLEGAKAELTTRDVTSTKDVKENEMTLSVFGKDANGTLAPQASKATFTVTDKDGKKVKDGSGESFKVEAEHYTAGETYTVTVKVGTLTVATKTFKVTENAVVPTVSFNNNKVTTDKDVTVLDAVKDLVSVKVADSKAKVEVTGIKYISSNSAVIDGTDGTAKAKTDGTATLYVSAVTVSVTGDINEQEKGTFIVPVSNQAITFTTTAKAAAEATAKAILDEAASSAVTLKTTGTTSVEKLASVQSVAKTGLSADSKLLVTAIVNEAGGQAPTSLADVVKFFKESKTPVNLSNIKLEDGKISITGPVVTPAEFKTLKGENGDLKKAYRMTVLEGSDKAKKLVKIAILPSGNAVIENVEAK